MNHVSLQSRPTHIHASYAMHACTFPAGGSGSGRRGDGVFVRRGKVWMNWMQGFFFSAHGVESSSTPAPINHSVPPHLLFPASKQEKEKERKKERGFMYARVSIGAHVIIRV